ncbi:MAG TPA: hypothetical protein VNO86_03815 [Candidatus Binatia bacterium]|nr:hypothetical protein [Candidatus Binatia bacterium]
MRLVEIARAILLSGPEEVRFFGRIALYALVVGVVYWFLTYETAGTVLLVGFGLCALFASLVLGHGARGVGAGAGRPVGAGAGRAVGERPPTETDPERPFVDESGRLPAPGLAPFGMGVGLAMAALGIAFGPWLVLAGLVLVAWAGLGWLRSAMAEHEAAVRDVGGGERAASGPAPDAPAGSGTEVRAAASPGHGSGADH